MSLLLALVLGSGLNVAAYPLSAIEHDPKAPAEYLYMYQGNLIEIPRHTAGEVLATCTAHGAPSEFGCAVWPEDHSSCVIVYHVDKPHVYWHEIAHCNGYDHD